MIDNCFLTVKWVIFPLIINLLFNLPFSLKNQALQSISFSLPSSNTILSNFKLYADGLLNSTREVFTSQFLAFLTSAYLFSES